MNSCNICFGIVNNIQEYGSIIPHRNHCLTNHSRLSVGCYVVCPCPVHLTARVPYLFDNLSSAMLIATNEVSLAMNIYTWFVLKRVLVNMFAWIMATRY